MTDAELRAAIRDAHALGLAVFVKPHVWVPDNWAGAVAMGSEADWTSGSRITSVNWNRSRGSPRRKKRKRS